MLKSSLCDHSDAYILVKVKLTITGAGADAEAKQANKRNKGVVFKNFAPLIGCISEMNNTQVDNARYLDVVMPMYNLIEQLFKIIFILFSIIVQKHQDVYGNITEMNLF